MAVSRFNAFSRLTRELEEARSALVPGISAGIALASRLGLSLTTGIWPSRCSSSLVTPAMADYRQTSIGEPWRAVRRPRSTTCPGGPSISSLPSWPARGLLLRHRPSLLSISAGRLSGFGAALWWKASAWRRASTKLLRRYSRLAGALDWWSASRSRLPRRYQATKAFQSGMVPAVIDPEIDATRNARHSPFFVALTYRLDDLLGRIDDDRSCCLHRQTPAGFSHLLHSMTGIAPPVGEPGNP
jgi:hypothetical protein